MSRVQGEEEETGRTARGSRSAESRRALLGAPPLPREHGAWVMLYTPLLIVLLAEPGARFLPFLLLVIAATSAFCLQHIVASAIRRRALDRNRGWFVLYFGLFLASAVPLLLDDRRGDLLRIGILAAALFGIQAVPLLLRSRRRFDRTLAGEIVGVLALTLTGPAASVVARGALDPAAWCLWAGMLLYFTSGVFFVNLLLAAGRFRESIDPRARWRLGRAHLFYHALLVALVVKLSATMPPRIALLFVLAGAPLLVRAFQGWATLSNEHPNLKRVGLRELLYTLWFAGFSVAWLRSTGGAGGW